MAINSFDLCCDKFPTKSACSTNSSKGANSCRILKLNFAPDSSLSCNNTKGGKIKNNNSKSPYLTADRVQLLSRVTEKRLAVHKKTTDFVSSFPLAVNLYKASSDEFKSSKKSNKKVKKSVLTLPNAPLPVPQACTVSDMNDSEYCGQNDEDRKQKAIKKRIPIQSNRKARVREKDFEFYDRDAQYCSQLNINLDSSSTDLMKNFNGDGKRISNKKKNTSNYNKTQTANKNNLNDVWTVLRNINRFQFRPSPPMSVESMSPIKKTIKKRRTNRKDTRVIETCRTEEFAYISRYELDNKSPRSFSQSSSIDRITVIDKQNEFSKICEEFEKRLLKTHNFLKDSNNNKNRSQKNKFHSRNSKNNVRALGNGVPKENKQLVKKKKKGAKSASDHKSKSETTNSNTVNKDSIADEGNSLITDTCDISSHQTQNDVTYTTAGSFVYSDNSGSSKAEAEKFSDKARLMKDGTQVTPISPEMSNSQSNDTTKDNIGKGHELNINSIVNKKLDPQKRKPRLVTTMPSSCMMPKLTQAEIRRRIAHIRFPVLVLGKDQDSSNVQVQNYDPPQFDGLDKHIWPFMIEWTNNPPINKTRNKDSKRKSSYNRHCSSYPSNDSSSIKSNKISIETAVNKIPIVKDKINANNDLIKIKKAEGKRTTPSTGINDKLLQCTKKQKSIVQLKEKMLNFLYKKTSSRNFIGDHQTVENDAMKCRTLVNSNKVEPTTFGQVRPVVPNVIPIKIGAPTPIPSIVTNKKTPHYAYPWAKAKWASDFIENVIKKIRSGVYYTHDNKDGSRYQPALKEVSVQAGTLCDSSDSTQTYESDMEHARKQALTTQKNIMSIPGFGNSQPALEIKTLNMTQIAIKHCVTNVLFQFDVTVPTKINRSTTNISKSLPVIPIEITKSHTKIYKCNTTILNAMLPAELCSILPRMISDIFKVNVDSDIPPALCPVKTDSCLSTISELTRGENFDTLYPIASIQILPAIRKPLIQGRFTNKMRTLKLKPSKINIRLCYNHDLVTELLPKVVILNLSEYLVYPIYNMNVKKDMNAKLSETKLNMPLILTNNQSSPCTALEVYSGNNKCSTCTALEVYSGNNKRLRSSFKPFNFMSMIKSILSNYNLQINRNLTSYFDMLKLQYDGKNIKINVSMINNVGIKRNMTVTVSNLKIHSIYEALPKMTTRKNENTRTYQSETNIKCIEYKEDSLANKTEVTEMNQVSGNKIKRSKGFYKLLYRKCKSTSNIPTGEKNVNTPLSKIKNLDEFFQVLGSKKMLCSVFDGYSAKKILSSIVEMKNWITEINPKQALLILLLTNKKDTPNLVRFRPILLQGIAVNRITRATELDMEIEVIERENLNKFSQQYEGISYLPESATNYDNLLEELYWIAKTTASDYQKPFDESSERLLKSLLEKRKKLNPSYLRVMARYVGLGLLKSPTKT